MPFTDTPWIDFVERTENSSLSGEAKRHKRRKHMSTILRLVTANIKDERYELRKEHRWLEEFEMRRDERFTEADKVFVQSPKEMVNILFLYVDRWLGQRIQGQLTKELYPYVKGKRSSRPQRISSKECPECLHQARKTHKKAALEQIYAKLFKPTDNKVLPIWLHKNSRSWCTFAKRAIAFCCRYCKRLKQDQNSRSKQFGIRILQYFGGLTIASTQSPLFFLRKLEDKVQAILLRMGGNWKDQEAQLLLEIERLELEANSLRSEKETREEKVKGLKDEVASLRRKGEDREAQGQLATNNLQKEVSDFQTEVKNQAKKLQEDVEKLQNQVISLKGDGEIGGVRLDSKLDELRREVQDLQAEGKKIEEEHGNWIKGLQDSATSLGKEEKERGTQLQAGLVALRNEVQLICEEGESREKKHQDQFKGLEDGIGSLHKEHETRNEQMLRLEEGIDQLRKAKNEVLTEAVKNARDKERDMMMHVYYRYLMENLPDNPNLKPGTNPNGGRIDYRYNFHWRQLWSQAVDKAVTEKKGPLKVLLDSLDLKGIEPDQIKEAGGRLYGKYSAYIHHVGEHLGDYAKGRDLIADETELEIIEVLKPLVSKIKANDSVDWDAERAQFI